MARARARACQWTVCLRKFTLSYSGLTVCQRLGHRPVIDEHEWRAHAVTSPRTPPRTARASPRAIHLHSSQRATMPACAACAAPAALACGACAAPAHKAACGAAARAAAVAAQSKIFASYFAACSQCGRLGARAARADNAIYPAAAGAPEQTAAAAARGCGGAAAAEPERTVRTTVHGAKSSEAGVCSCAHMAAPIEPGLPPFFK